MAASRARLTGAIIPAPLNPPLVRSGVLSTPLTSLLALSLLLTGLAEPRQSGPTSAAIDADVWKPVSASVVNDDIAAMGKVYHPEAILVTSAGTRRISEALAGWGKDIVANKANGTRATVAFRFTNRQDDAETAFETGIFRCTVTDRAGKVRPSYTRMEALLVGSSGNSGKSVKGMGAVFSGQSPWS
jgi:ketosteroid isomerase-like protein